MTDAIKKTTRVVWPYLLVGAMALLAAGTISNQLRINAANQRLAMQAANGQKALTRQCRLLPVSLKLYGDMLRRGVISAGDFALVQDTAVKACPRP